MRTRILYQRVEFWRRVDRVRGGRAGGFGAAWMVLVGKALVLFLVLLLDFAIFDDGVFFSASLRGSCEGNGAVDSDWS